MILANVTTPRSIAFSANGKKLFIGDDANDRNYINII